MRTARVALIMLFCAGVGFAAIEMLGERERAPLSELYLAPDSALDFGALAAGDRAQRTVIATNAGATPLVLETATDSEGFSVVPPSLSLPPGESVALTVRFLPHDAGREYHGRLRVIEPSGAVPEQDIELRGEAHGLAMIRIDPASLAFGEVEVDGDAMASLRIENQGEFELELDSVAALEPFSVQGSTTTLAPGEGADFEVRFAPRELGIFEADLHVRSSDPARRSVLVNLRGLGVKELPEAYLAIETDRLEFGAVPLGASATQWVNVTNLGTDPLNITRIAVSGPFEGPRRGWRIEPAANYKIGFRFSPTELGGTSGHVTIYSNDPDQGAIEMDLLGAGIEAGPGQTAGSSEDDDGRLVRRDQAGRGGGTAGDGSDGATLAGADEAGRDGAAAEPGQLPPDEMDPLVAEPAAIGEGGRVTLGTHEAPLTNFMVNGEIRFANGDTSFDIPNITPAPIELPFGQYMEIQPFSLSGEIGPDGHVDIPTVFTLVDQAGNEFTVDAVVTTGPTSVLTPHGTFFTQTGQPCSGGHCELVFSAPTPKDSSWAGLPVSGRLPVGASNTSGTE